MNVCDKVTRYGTNMNDEKKNQYLVQTKFFFELFYHYYLEEKKINLKNYKTSERLLR